MSERGLEGFTGGQGKEIKKEVEQVEQESSRNAVDREMEEEGKHNNTRQWMIDGR